MAPSPSTHAIVQSLYADHQGWLKNWLRRRLGDASTAADMAQDTFVRLLSRQEPLDPIQEPRAFLTTVASRVLANHWRRRQLELAWLETLAGLPPALVPSEEERAILLEALHEVDRLLDGLPRQVRQAFLMSQLDGMKHAQVAQVLGVSVTTVKRHLARAAAQCYFADVLPAAAP